MGVQAFPAGLPFDLPDKGIIRQFSEAALQDRKLALNAYLKALCRTDCVANHMAVTYFFNLNGTSGSISYTQNAFSTSPPMATMEDDPFRPIGGADPFKLVG